MQFKIKIQQIWSIHIKKKNQLKIEKKSFKKLMIFDILTLEIELKIISSSSKPILWIVKSCRNPISIELKHNTIRHQPTTRITYRARRPKWPRSTWPGSACSRRQTASRPAPAASPPSACSVCFRCAKTAAHFVPSRWPNTTPDSS